DEIVEFVNAEVVDPLIRLVELLDRDDLIPIHVRVRENFQSIEDLASGLRRRANLLYLRGDFANALAARVAASLVVRRQSCAALSVTLDADSGCSRSGIDEVGRARDDVEVWIALHVIGRQRIEDALLVAGEAQMMGERPQLLISIYVDAPVGAPHPLLRVGRPLCLRPDRGEDAQSK